MVSPSIHRIRRTTRPNDQSFQAVSGLAELDPNNLLIRIVMKKITEIPRKTNSSKAKLRRGNEEASNMTIRVHKPPPPSHSSLYEKRGTSWSHLFADKPTLLPFLLNKRPEWNAPTSHIEGEGLLLRLGATWGNMREIAERVSDTIQPLQLSERALSRGHTVSRTWVVDSTGS